MKTNEKNSDLRHRVLVVEDDEDFALTLALRLEETGKYDVTIASGFRSGRIKASSQLFDALLIDVDLGDGDGRKLCAELRKSGLWIPIIMLTALTSDDDTVMGMNAGATDYVNKPFRLPVLLARLEAHLLNHQHSSEAVTRFANLTFKPSNKIIVRDDTKEEIRLTEKEVGVINFLLRAQGRVVTRDDLLQNVWGYSRSANSHTVETHIYRLRRKIEDKGARGTLLRTEAGGYSLKIG